MNNMLDQLVEASLFGAGFVATEAMFNMALLAEYNVVGCKSGVHLPHDDSRPFHGHSYPVMFGFGFAAGMGLHPVFELFSTMPEGNAAFGLAFSGLVVATEGVFGKAGHAPWKEVYSYLSQRIDKSLEDGVLSRVKWLGVVPRTIADGASLVWLVPGWVGFGAAMKYVHDFYLRCTW